MYDLLRRNPTFLTMPHLYELTSPRNLRNKAHLVRHVILSFSVSLLTFDKEHRELLPGDVPVPGPAVQSGSPLPGCG